MKKMLKRLCTGFLALATVVTALPTTPVHAESKQYWTESAERVGIIEKVMNDGSVLTVEYFERLLEQIREIRLSDLLDFPPTRLGIQAVYELPAIFNRGKMLVGNNRVTGWLDLILKEWG